jgi:hypothetical protein
MKEKDTEIKKKIDNYFIGLSFSKHKTMIKLKHENGKKLSSIFGGER